MRHKSWILTTSGILAAVMCSPTFAQEITGPQTVVATDDGDTVVIVRGIRKSLETATDRKRRSAQIVDSIDAEDVGKLPDNNVNEAIARITGVQIERARGEGSGLKIRGMSDVQTTLNGAPNNTGVGRSASLNDIPSELLKSVQVYKNRTADQVEGGIAGTVNVDLRRPFDMPRGLTLAGSVRNVWANIGDTSSPYVSGLVANRFQTSVGEVGFLLNYSYQKNNYKEQWVTSESPAPFWGREVEALPAADALNAISPYKVQNGVEHGSIERNAYNAALQWRPRENLTFLLEVSGFDADERRARDFLEARVKDGPLGVGLSNLTYMPDGRTVKTLTITDTNLTDNDMLAVGPYARDTVLTTRNSRINAEVRWNVDRWNLSASVYRDENKLYEDWYQQMLRMKGLSAVRFDLSSDTMAEPGPTLVYLDASGNPLDMGNVANYNMFEIENGKGYDVSSETVVSFDANYHVSDENFIRSVQFGARKTNRDVDRSYGFRYARFGGVHTVALSDFPGGNQTELISADVPGYESQQWHRLSYESYLANFDAIRRLASSENTSSGGGGGYFNEETGTPYHWTVQWSTPEVPTERMMGTFTSTESTAALYMQALYGFDLFSFPVDGVVGGRWVSTKGESFSYDRDVVNIDNPNFDPNLPDDASNPRQIRSEKMVPRTTPGEYSDFLPSTHATVHFTPQLQLRLAYSKNVQRPDFRQATSFTFLDTINMSGWGGNADLKANREDNYDASLEYYFGRDGVISFAAYLKKPDGFIYDAVEPEVREDGTYNIARPRNASEGTFQGYEFQVQGFFDFLPGHWSNLGGQFNYTYNQIAKINYGSVDNNALGNSKYTYNAILYYDSPQLSARIAYNYRDRFRSSLYFTNVDGVRTDIYSPYVEATSRLDASVNWTPIRQLTLSLEGTNLLNDNTQLWFGKDKLLPQGLRVAARTIQLSARFRY